MIVLQMAKPNPVPCAKLLVFYKTLEYLPIFRGDACARVSHMEYDSFPFPVVSVADAAFGGEFERISYQVRYHLEDAVLIRVYQNIFVGWIEYQLYT